MEVNIFEKATREKLLFQTGTGNLYTQDLWDLSIDRLATQGKILKSSLKDLGDEDEDFGDSKTPSKEKTTLELKIAVIKHIYDVKVAEKKAKDEAQAKAKEKLRLQEILLNLKEKELQGKTPAEVQAMIDALG